MKIGIITFHNSYNCGSMLESYAIMKYLRNNKYNAELIDFSTEGQRKLYNTFFQNNSVKNVLKNIIIAPHKKRIDYNNLKYEEFKNKNFVLSHKIIDNDFSKLDYDCIIAGSDQIWNVTIEDYSENYFLPWANTRKIAYAPSFGAKNPQEYDNENIEKYRNYLKDLDAVSIRENNGQKWIKEISDLDVPVLIDPTLLLDSDEYDKIIDDSCTPSGDYIFLYCPSFKKDICKFVKKISDKYHLPVIAWSTKSFYIKQIYKLGFELPNYESPAVYLSLIKNAKLVFTTSFHGTIFSTIYKKNFFVIKNGEMYGNDDRVLTLIKTLGIENRLIEYNFDDKFDYMKNVNYEKYNINLPKEQEKAKEFLLNNIGDEKNEISK